MCCFLKYLLAIVDGLARYLVKKRAWQAYTSLSLITGKPKRIIALGDDLLYGLSKVCSAAAHKSKSKAIKSRYPSNLLLKYLLMMFTTIA